jgi:mannose-6-phosphate isomerase-like protein (cupin superfamily)
VTEPARIIYQAAEPYESGMVVEEVDAATPGSTGWPFRAARFDVPPGATTERDVHDVAELWLVRSGRGTVTSGDTALDVAAGDMVYFAGRVPHQITNPGPDQMHLFSVWWRVS